MENTTIKIYADTKKQLDCFREYKNESYDEVLKKLLYIIKCFRTEPELSDEAVRAIEKARERMAKGKFYTDAQLRKRYGMDARS